MTWDIDHYRVGIKFFVELVLHAPLVEEHSWDNRFLHVRRVEGVMEVKVLLWATFGQITLGNHAQKKIRTMVYFCASVDVVPLSQLLYGSLPVASSVV